MIDWPWEIWADKIYSCFHQWWIVSKLLCPSKDGESIAFNACTASWYGACISGDVLTLHACNPEFPFPSQILVHLPPPRNDREYQSFLHNTRDVRKLLYTRRAKHAEVTTSTTHNPEIVSKALKQDPSIIHMCSDAHFKACLKTNNDSNKSSCAASSNPDGSGSVVGLLPRTDSRSQTSKIDITQLPSFTTLSLPPILKESTTTTPAFNKFGHQGQNVYSPSNVTTSADPVINPFSFYLQLQNPARSHDTITSGTVEDLKNIQEAQSHFTNLSQGSHLFTPFDTSLYGSHRSMEVIIFLFRLVVD